MEEAAENGKESLHSAHASGMNEMAYFRHVKLHVHRLQGAQGIEIIWPY